ncbi:MAG: hypothetical protein M3314_05160 [Actinomycetota bacterium]|jgi:hypothetical protein|nr:hypothetical protein [Actinomycetota bacterium]
MNVLSHPPAILVNMNDQLVLLEDDDQQWRLDERTREIGRRGVAQARQALRQADRPAA